MEELRAWLPPLIAAAALFWTLISAARGARRSEVDKLGAEIELLKVDQADTKSRVATAELQIRSLPDKDSSHRLEMAITRLEGRLETMDEKLKPVAIMAERANNIISLERRDDRGR